MSRDYAAKPDRPKKPRTSNLPPRKAAKSAPKTRASKQSPAAAARASKRWMLLVVLLGGFIGTLVYLDKVPHIPFIQDTDPATSKQAPPPPHKEPTVISKPENKPAKTVAQEPDSKKQNPPEGKFRFYELLPDSKVTPPQIEVYAPEPVKPDKPVQYSLQTGSFRNQADAEKQRAQIAFLGLRAQIETVTLAENNIWYRVHVGPFSSRKSTDNAIDKLVAINIRPLSRSIPTK